MKKLFLGIAAVGMLFVSCEKDNDSADQETTSSENNSTADMFFNHVYDVYQAELDAAEEDAGLQPSGGQSVSDWDHDTCAYITYTLSNDSSYVSSIVVDYGTTGCEWRGRIRKGKINISLTGRMINQGSVATVTLENFSVDDFPVTGTKTITSNGIDFSNLSDITYGYEVQVTNAQVTTPDGTASFTWNANRTTTWHINAGYVLFDGTANGVNVDGTAFTITTETPLKAITGCSRIVSGILKVTPQGYETRTLDYGNGTCDNQATVSVGEQTFTITLN